MTLFTDDCFFFYSLFIFVYASPVLLAMKKVAFDLKRESLIVFFAKAFFTQPPKIVLIGHIIIMWDRMGFKWGLKHMNYLLRYAQTVLCCYHGDTVGPPTWNETSCLPVNLFLYLFSLCLSTLKRYFLFATGTILIHAYVFWYFNPHPNRLVDVSCNCWNW